MDYTSLAERVIVLETEWTQAKEDLKKINLKLDELLILKSKGLGALWLIGLLIGSGLTSFVVHLFGKPQ